MRAGRNRHRVQLEQNTITQAADGGAVETWERQATVWGEVLEIRGREYLTAREVHADLTTVIRIRYRPGIEPLLWRVKALDHTYNVEHVVDLAGRRRELELLCNRVE